MDEQTFLDAVRGKARRTKQWVAPKLTYTADSFSDAYTILRNDQLGFIGLIILGFFVFVAIFAEPLAPYDPMQRNLEARLEPPSMAHPLGTTVVGRDVLSQLIFGTRTTLLVGLAAGLTSVTLGTTIGIVTGYLGGYVDDVLMRLTDLAYGIPFLPFALALVFILGASLVNIIVAISLIMWRSTARVVRAQTLTVKEQPYIESAEAAGVGHLRMMARHVLPNVFPIVVLYTALTMGWSILAEANLAFLGFGDPLRVSWGTMIFGTYSQDVIRTALWWVIPPGICIMLIVMAVFFIGRALEEYINPELKEA